MSSVGLGLHCTRSMTSCMLRSTSPMSPHQACMPSLFKDSHMKWGDALITISHQTTKCHIQLPHSHDSHLANPPTSTPHISVSTPMHPHAPPAVTSSRGSTSSTLVSTTLATPSGSSTCLAVPSAHLPTSALTPMSVSPSHGNTAPPGTPMEINATRTQQQTVCSNQGMPHHTSG